MRALNVFFNPLFKIFIAQRSEGSQMPLASPNQPFIIVGYANRPIIGGQRHSHRDFNKRLSRFGLHFSEQLSSELSSVHPLQGVFIALAYSRVLGPKCDNDEEDGDQGQTEYDYISSHAREFSPVGLGLLWGRCPISPGVCGGRGG